MGFLRQFAKRGVNTVADLRPPTAAAVATHRQSSLDMEALCRWSPRDPGATHLCDILIAQTVCAAGRRVCLCSGHGSSARGHGILEPRMDYSGGVFRRLGVFP